MVVRRRNHAAGVPPETTAKMELARFRICVKGSCRHGTCCMLTELSHRRIRCEICRDLLRVARHYCGIIGWGSVHGIDRNGLKALCHIKTALWGGNESGRSDTAYMASIQCTRLQKLLQLLKQVLAYGHVHHSWAVNAIRRGHVRIGVVPTRDANDGVDYLGRVLVEGRAVSTSLCFGPTTSSAPSSQLDFPSRKKLPTTKMARTSKAIMNISKLRSMFFPMAQPIMTTSGPLKSAVWIEGPRQWYSATLMTPSVKLSA